jgi:endonuclease/exonuclease/phosphatase family metal-dependent hydrolase
MAKFLKRCILFVALPAATLVPAFFAVAWAKYHTRAAVEIVFDAADATLAYSVDTLTVTTWNIGYAAMDSAADFFMDGGAMVRRPQQQTARNLRHIAQTLQALRSDVFLLQEVDRNAHRSYRMNEADTIRRYLVDYQCFFADNFDVFFVPVPLREPIGKVTAGLLSCSRWQPSRVERRAYPATDPVPARWFNLQRCFAVSRFPLADGKELVMVNTHNSAFDNGSARAKEMETLKIFMQSEYARGNYVIVGGDWNQTASRQPIVGTPQYTPVPVPDGFISGGWVLVCDTLRPSVRFADKPYRAGVSLTAVVDFFVLSPNLVPVSITTAALNFAHSDHEPVTVKVMIRSMEGVAAGL